MNKTKKFILIPTEKYSSHPSSWKCVFIFQYIKAITEIHTISKCTEQQATTIDTFAIHLLYIRLREYHGREERRL